MAMVMTKATNDGNRLTPAAHMELSPSEHRPGETGTRHVGTSSLPPIPPPRQQSNCFSLGIINVDDYHAMLGPVFSLPWVILSRMLV